MLKLKELHIQGIGRFVDEQVIFFDNLGTLVQVDGQNNNTGGSSGAGKSTIFNALDFLFGINNIPNTVLKSRFSDSMSVKGVFELDGKPLIITRGKKLSIELDGVVTMGSSKISEEKLDEIIAIPRELFRPILHKRQKEGGFFLKMTPKEINDFLTSCLGLGNFKDKIETVDLKNKELSEQKLRIASSLEANILGLKATRDALIFHGTGPVKDVDQNLILDLKHKAEKSKAAWTVLGLNQKIEMDALQLTKPQVNGESFDRTRLEQAKNDAASFERQINELKNQEKDKRNKVSLLLWQAQSDLAKAQNAVSEGLLASKKIVEVTEQIKNIRDGKCYTCGQGWHDKNSEKTLTLNLFTLKKTMDNGKEAEGRLSELQELNDRLSKEVNSIAAVDLGTLPDQLREANTSYKIECIAERTHQSAQMDKLRAVMDQFSAKEASLRQTHAIAAEQVRGQAEIDRRALDTAIDKFRAYEEARALYEEYVASMKTQEKEYEDKISELTLLHVKLHDKLILAEELKRGLKSYLSCSFDDALETIGDNATKLIRNIPNMANATIQLEGIKETQDGKIKEEVNAVIHMDGEENVDIRSFSGGERTSIDLAIDLSVIELIENRTNKGIDIFILDEPFDGLDSACVEMALEVLKNSSLNKRLVIVDHNPITKEYIGGGIVVERNGDTSKIVQ